MDNPSFAKCVSGQFDADIDILLIGDVTNDFYLGSMFARSAKELGKCCYLINIQNEVAYPSMQHFLGKVFYKISGKLPLEWWQFNNKVAKCVLKLKPKLVLITGIVPLSNQVFEAANKVNAKVANYLTDYPWNPNHRHTKFISNLKRYDFIFSTKTLILLELISSGVKATEFLPFAYDPFVHRKPDINDSKLSFESDICFVGTGDRERLPYFEAISSLITNKNFRLYGGLWDKILVRGWNKSSPVFNNDFRSAINQSNLCLGILRKANKDLSTMRSFEIPACGGTAILEDTDEHRSIFPEYPEYGFFTSPLDLAEKCKWLLENPIELAKMKEIGYKTIKEQNHTYTHRLKTMMERLSL